LFLLYFRIGDAPWWDRFDFFGGSPLQMRLVLNCFSRSAEIGWLDKLTAFYFPSSIYGEQAHSIFIFISLLIWISFFFFVCTQVFRVENFGG